MFKIKTRGPCVVAESHLVTGKITHREYLLYFYLGVLVEKVGAGAGLGSRSFSIAGEFEVEGEVTTAVMGR